MIDYDQFCGVPKTGGQHEPAGSSDVPEITVVELEHRLKAGLCSATLIDVREPHEWDIVRIPGAVLMPKASVQDHLAELAQHSEVLVYCKSGGRSADVTRLLLSAGFNNVKNVKGGVEAWATEIDPSLPIY